MRTHTSGAGPRTVVGVDGSEHARAAALWGADEAILHGQALWLVHAANLDRLDRFASFETSEHARTNGTAVLAAAEEEIRSRFPGLDLTVKLSRRNPVTALHSAVGPGGTIVVGSRGSGGFGPLLLGSVGLEAVVGSPAPVVVVRGETGRGSGAPVTAAVRDEHDAVWLDRAAREAEVRECPLRLLNIRSILGRFDGRPAPTEDEERPGDSRRQFLTDLAASIREARPGLTVQAGADSARSAASALVEASRKSELLVVGSHERRSVSALGLGHVVHALLHHAHCPVQIVPYTRDERGVAEEALGDDVV